MDSVRFGKALGVGAREAGRALAKAADAAAAPNPTVRKAGVAAGNKVQQGITQVRTVSKGVQRGRKHFAKAAWGPFLRLSGVLWLEVTGVFFSLFALTMGIEVWKHRADLVGSGPARGHVWLALFVGGAFAYFTVSSFIRASRRGRR